MNNKIRYEKQSIIKIECIYCKNITNLYSINSHLRGKQCQIYQNLTTDKNLNEYLLDINKQKKAVKYGKKAPPLKFNY